ncbi:malate dehydrogenase [Campylobacter sp. RM9344]|uniref:Malate dehydrogenase n=1 Tax=Campylobacter californiensis TaxID=1032243 RepID=A0AAW3ZXW8_9BACT|nr:MULTISPECIES: malate dehydrogenase [unclassified Campylobacter]MBE2984274.1 malate dehydrogenase [Campylobacter sp. RM6883]MBE2985971.1 malate dehydrogenase [Campylobacter sp. RM12919]MBE2988349.1 malate dehydrogenase [Campylobacter sp. RM12920]MBE2994859.1 malate dehydrogenase [Campylobacter sp. RM6913]MBE3021368.1 malate dehydrogenase [Campylobacter sp. 7477a]MBE3029503.1 malate dehydrogenase [Campylobacter sp. RM9344]
MKISIIGAGNVGASIAYALCMREVCDEIALVDIFNDVAKAKAIDITQASCVFGAKTKVVGADNFELVKNSDIVVVTAGSPRKDGQSREDLLIKNALVVKSSAENIAKFAPNAIIIVVTNPLDVMVWVARKFSGFDKSRVLGMAGELDGARCRFELAQILSQDMSELRTKVVGAHNDKMVISNKNINVNLNKENFEVLKHETKTGGAKIVKLLGTSAYYAPAAAVVKMCEEIKDQKGEIVSASVILDDDLSCGRLVKLSKNGVGEILELNLDQEDLDELNASQDEIRKNINFLKENL